MKIEIPAVEGFFTVEEEAHLIGGRFKKSGSYCFPKDLGGSDPNFTEDEVEAALQALDLNHDGKVSCEGKSQSGLWNFEKHFFLFCRVY